MATPFKMNQSPHKTGAIEGTPLHQAALIKQGLKYLPKIFKKVKSLFTKAKPKVNPKNPFVDPIKAKYTSGLTSKIRTDYSNTFLKEGVLKVK